jgi:hypothetical protein
METPKTGVLYYFEKPDLNVNPQMYEPVSYENWKMLRELEPTKFVLDYPGYVELKKEQFDKEVENRKNTSLYLKSVYYSFYPEMIADTKKAIKRIVDSPFFQKWVTEDYEKIVKEILWN